MIEIEKPKIECLELSEENGYGKFTVEPLERGYGTTLGNSLRRILLSSLPGGAINSIKIDGVLHEFSTVPGVVEDVTEIILNVKQLALAIHSDGEKTLVIDANKEGVSEIEKTQLMTQAMNKIKEATVLLEQANELAQKYAEYGKDFELTGNLLKFTELINGFFDIESMDAKDLQKVMYYINIILGATGK